MLIGQQKVVGDPADPMTFGFGDPNHDRGMADIRGQRHCGVEEILDGIMSVRPTLDKLMNDIRIRTARQLLERSFQKAYVYRTVSTDQYYLRFISDHEDDDHELAKTLQKEINRILHDDDEYLKLYEVV
jgi:hypothetical protein